MAETFGSMRAFPGQDGIDLMPRARRVADIEPSTIDWICRGRIAAGKITVLDGDPGLGKSTIALDWAARITTGRVLPGSANWQSNAVVTRPRGVVLLSAEDGESDTIRPRLDAAGADTTRVTVLKMQDEAGNEFLPTLGRHLWAIEQQIEANNAAMLIIDPFMAYLDSETNSNRDQDIRRVLSPVASMAERTGCAVVVLRHLNKATGMAGLYRGGGSIGIIGAARVGLLAHKDNEDDTGQRRLILVQKCNIGPEANTLVYRIVGVDGTDSSRVEWLGESEITASAVMGQPVEAVDRQDATEAELWLAEYLMAGPTSAVEVFREGTKAGFSNKTMKRAKSSLHVASKKSGFGSEWKWELPGTIQPPEKPFQTIGKSTPLLQVVPPKESQEGQRRGPSE